MTTVAASDPQTQRPAARVFLCVVDETTEMGVAIRYASRRAKSTGGHVALLYVIEPMEFQAWGALEALMQEEQRTGAEQALQRLAREVHTISGSMPALYIREGNRRDELMRLIQEDPTVSVLVLAASAGPEGPGPLITHLAGKTMGRLRIPLTIVPGGLTPEQVDAIS